MSGFSVLTASAAITCCFIACRFEPADPKPGDLPEAGGTVSVAGNTGSGRAGSGASHAGRASSPDSEAGSGASARAGSGGDSDAGASGEGPAAGGVVNTSAGSGTGGGAFELEVAGEGGALPANCEQDHATCAVITQPACEFAENVGKSAVVTCGQAAVVADIACGQCGQVKVFVYFDGKNCWQGAPDCNAGSFRGKFLYPHAP